MHKIIPLLACAVRGGAEAAPRAAGVPVLVCPGATYPCSPYLLPTATSCGVLFQNGPNAFDLMDCSSFFFLFYFNSSTPNFQGEGCAVGCLCLGAHAKALVGDFFKLTWQMQLTRQTWSGHYWHRRHTRRCRDAVMAFRWWPLSGTGLSGAPGG